MGSSQSIVGYGVVADDYMTEFERSQMEYEGVIQFPATVLAIEDEEVYYGA